MGIHSIVAPEGVDIDKLLSEAAECQGVPDTQDNPRGLEWRIYFAQVNAERRRQSARRSARRREKATRRDPKSWRPARAGVLAARRERYGEDDHCPYLGG